MYFEFINILVGIFFFIFTVAGVIYLLAWIFS